MARAACTASAAITGSSTGARSSGRSRSSRASSSRSCTSRPIRAASSSIRRTSLSASSRELAAPCRYSSAKPRIVVSGVRSSCEASATNCRIRSSDSRARLSAARAARSAWRAAASEALCALNAASICESMALSARARFPTSVRAGPGRPPSGSGTRRARSPAAIASAVRSIWLNGRRLVRTAHTPTAARRPSTPAPINTSSQTSRVTALSASDRFAATISRVPSGRGVMMVRHCSPPRTASTVYGSPERRSASSRVAGRRGRAAGSYRV